MEAGSKEQTARPVGGIAWRRLPLAALVAAVAASVANVLVYYAASGLGFVSQSAPFISTPSGESPLTAGMVVATSVAGTVGAAVVFAGIGLFAQRPIRLFRIVAVVVLALSLIPPAIMPGVPVATILSLEAMHIVAWAVIVGILTTMARQGDTQ